MKKLTLIIAVAGMIGLSSCAKDVECTYTNSNGDKSTVTLTNDDATICFNDECETLTYEEIEENDPEVTDKKSAQNSLEDEGYSCK